MTETFEAPARPAGANYIGGEWMPSRAGRTYEKRNPARPSDVVGSFPASGEEDVAAAVEAAGRRVRGLGRTPGGAARGRAAEGRRRRHRRARGGDRAGHDARDGQAAARGADGVGAGRRDPPLLRGGEAYRPTGELYEQAANGRAGLHAAAPARRRRADHAVELPRRDPGLEARAGADLRQHGRDQARAGGAAHRAQPRRGARRGRAAAGRAERRHRPRRGGRAAARPPPAGAGGLVHRLGRGRAPGARRGDRARQARPARARRPQPADRHGRRRARRRRSRPRTPARSGRPGRSARRRGGSTSRTRSTTSSGDSCSSGSSAARSATRSDPDDRGRAARERDSS